MENHRVQFSKCYKKNYEQKKEANEATETIITDLSDVCTRWATAELGHLKSRWEQLQSSQFGFCEKGFCPIVKGYLGWIYRSTCWISQ